MFKKFLAQKKLVVALIAKHLVVSATCATVDFVGFGLSVYYFKMSVTLAYALAFAAATTVGFFGHTYFTFGVGRFHLKNALLFIIQATLSFLAGYLLLKGLIGLGFPVMAAKLVQLGLVFFFNLSAGKLLTFKKRAVTR